MTRKKRIKATTQEELDRIPKDFDGIVVVDMATDKSRHPPIKLLTVDPHFKEIEAINHANIELHKRQHAELYDNSYAILYEKSSAVLHGNLYGEFYEESSGIAKNHSKFQSFENSSVQDKRPEEVKEAELSPYQRKKLEQRREKRAGKQRSGTTKKEAKAKTRKKEKL